MKYKCLVFDHDDTVVDSTAAIHYPCFAEYLSLYHPGKSCTLEEYFIKNFSPGFVPMCRDEYGFTEEEMVHETAYWREYVKDRIPPVFPGVREIMERHKAEGGIIAVVSHSFAENIYRDYKANSLPEPDIVFGWEQPVERRKPKPWPLEEIMRRFGLDRSELLMIDDLKPGYDMAVSCGVDFAAVGWANDIGEIESYMRENSSFYFKSVEKLSEFLHK